MNYYAPTYFMYHSFIFCLFLFREHHDTKFEAASMIFNIALWYTKHAAQISGKEE